MPVGSHWESLQHSRSLTFCQVALVNQPWDDVAILEVEVIVTAKDVGWNDTGEHAAMLLMVGPVVNRRQTLAHNGNGVSIRNKL